MSREVLTIFCRAESVFHLRQTRNTHSIYLRKTNAEACTAFTLESHLKLTDLPTSSGMPTFSPSNYLCCT